MPTIKRKGLHRKMASYAALILALASSSLDAQPARPPQPADGFSSSLPGSLARFAERLAGTPYLSGGQTLQGVDCSGLVSLVYRRTAGIGLPGGVGALFAVGTGVQPPFHLGDLLFFDTETVGTPRHPTHVAIYVGHGRLVHAASEGARTGVIVSSLLDRYYQQRYLAARRVFPWPRPVLNMILTDDPVSTPAGRSYPSHERLRIAVYNRMTGGGPMDLSLALDGVAVLTRRITPSRSRPAVLDLAPDAGRWTVTVSRILRGRVLGSLTFQVDE